MADRIPLPRVTLLAIALYGAASLGCAALPDRIVEPQFHNPLPQIHRVAVLPFFNQSSEPTVNGEAVAIAYYNELQLIPGFEVMPVGVARRMFLASVEATGQEPRSGADFQRLAQQMNVDAVIVGSVTEYSPYYPPRMGLAVNWYAANPGFHPIPAGYGLPWGRAEEEFIPGALVQEAEFALAREQLKTQTPQLPPDNPAVSTIAPVGRNLAVENRNGRTPSDDRARPLDSERLPASTARAESLQPPQPPPDASVLSRDGNAGDASLAMAPLLPPDWPDPRGLIPPPPAPDRPSLRPQHAPLMTHTRIYHGQDARFTERLATYYYLRDDARFGGWKGYLERPADFVRFCCYLHVTETLAARGGASDARVLWRWPIGRYER
jgi:hypothetical protein